MCEKVDLWINNVWINGINKDSNYVPLQKTGKKIREFTFKNGISMFCITESQHKIIKVIITERLLTCHSITKCFWETGH